MQREAKQAIAGIERTGGSLEQLLPRLRAMTLDQFGELLLELPSSEYPKLSAILPKKAPDSVQQQWTGSSGITLLRQSTSFVNFLVTTYTEITGQSIARAKVLDFGCGWGRLLRLMLYYVDPKQLYGCDAWEESLGHIRAARIPASIEKSETIPTDLPFPPGVEFDLIYAFSIFTHLSEPATTAVLRAFGKRISKRGILVITIRPEEFWDFLSERRQQDCGALQREHQQRGFSFLPADSKKRESVYGDTSISRQYLESHFPELEIVKMGNTLIDPYQTFGVLRHRGQK